MSSNGPQKGDQYGSYRYNDNGIIRIGMLISIPGQEDEFFVRDFIDLIPEDQPDFDEEEGEEHINIRDVPLVKLVSEEDNNPRKRVQRRDIIEPVFVVGEKFFIDGSLPLFRSGMSGVYRIR